MTFWRIFVRVLPSRPFTALAALWWHVTGRRIRARNRLRAAGERLPFAYEFWMRHIEAQADPTADVDAVADKLASLPSFSIAVLLEGASSQDIATTIRSIESQGYPPCDLVLVGATADAADVPPAVRERTSFAASFRQPALAQVKGDFVVPIRAGDQLSRSALHRYAEAAEAEPSAKILYGDHDEVDAKGRRRNPWFKPRWNEELFFAQDYLSGAVAISTAAARAAAQQDDFSRSSPVYDLLLRIVTGSEVSIIHVPHITAHVRTGARAGDQQARLEVVSKYVSGRGGSAAGGLFDTVKVAWPLPSELPLVSIIVPTKDKIHLLRACVETLLGRTSYAKFELLIVDNGSEEAATRRYLAAIASNTHVRVLSYPHAYNYSAINNFAARQANGSYVCLLNNDTEVIEADWLTEMMRYAVRPEIGAVGAKLLYADQSIQHAGVIVGIGDAAGHAHRNLPASKPGYFCRAHVAQFVTAVTGACLLVDKRKFLAVGGLDEDGLAIAYNDVDLCLKLERAGWRNVYVPHAVLIHHESKSRLRDHSPTQIDRYRRELAVFQKRWNVESFHDPFFNPNLDRTSETFLIRL